MNSLVLTGVFETPEVLIIPEFLEHSVYDNLFAEGR